MYATVRFYRVACFGDPRGPWRLQRDQARRDAIDQELGCFDERGTFFALVPGTIQSIELPVTLLRAALEPTARPRPPQPAARPRASLRS